jgi:Transposase domain (DUF772)
VVVRADAKFIVKLEPRRLSSFEGQLPRNGFATHIVVRVYQRISILSGLLVEGHRCDPELLLRTLLIGYLYGISSERKLVEELGMHLAWRWFTGLGFDHGDLRDQQ